jgi:L-lactate dehydrogenase (cytochrome)
VYLNTDRKKSEEVLQQADRLGAKAIVFTVDVMRQSKRTLDVRSKRQSKPWFDPNADAAPEPKKSVSESISGYQDFNLTWKDLDFIRVSATAPGV